jgi:hypothetical protein
MMVKLRILIIVTIVSFLLNSCLWDDSSSDSLPNDYRLGWVDVPSNRNISRNSGGVRIDAHIFEVGYNRNYIIAKQHPQIGDFGLGETDKTKLNWFVLQMKKRSTGEEIWGPLTENEFRSLCDELEISDIEFSIKYEVDENIRID